MKFENTEVWGFKHALRGMRNPLNSWDKSDSRYATKLDCQTIQGMEEGTFIIGDNDMKLAKKLIAGGSEHRKMLRQIMVSVDITAPLFWFKEFDTYKIGTTANSTSTMHKLTSEPITIDCFETDDYQPNLIFESGIDNHGDSAWDYDLIITDIIGSDEKNFFFTETYIGFLESLRLKYLETKDKKYWKELVRWLPESWLQTRTVTMNYENLRTMYHQRKNHKLNEWSGCDDNTKPNFISWIQSLPYAKEFIIEG